MFVELTKPDPNKIIRFSFECFRLRSVTRLLLVIYGIYSTIQQNRETVEPKFTGELQHFASTDI
jgi:hypothetical protein